MNALLEADALAVGYTGGQTIAEGLNLRLCAGELVCLIGQNGVGKSTLMRTLAAEQKPIAGQVRLMGEDAHAMPAKARAKRLSIVTTERIDAPHMDGQLLVELGRHPHTDWTGQLTPYDRERVAWAIDAVAGEALARKRLNAMSDGERQRMMIARALAQDCPVMLLDEPTAFLDLPRRAEVLRLLRQIAREGYAVLVSTHDLDLALRLADVVWLMSPAVPLAVGAPEDLILQGAFERAFIGEGVAFDSASGTFRIAQATVGEVRLLGEGVRALWTQRALERKGYRIVDGARDAVHVLPDSWRVQRDGQEAHDCACLVDVLAML
jgi:iron complex transport system ATP-binding protein